MAGKFGAGMAWVFALLTIGVCFAIGKIGIGNYMVSLILTSAVFLGFAFLGGFATKASTGHVIAAMVVALIGYVGVQIFVIGSSAVSGMATMAKAANAAAGAGAGDAGTAALVAQAAATAAVKTGGGILEMITGFWKPLAGAFAASVIGAIIGSKMKGTPPKA